MVFILNDFFVPNIDVTKNTGTCGDQMISKDDCKAYASGGLKQETSADRGDWPSGCFQIIMSDSNKPYFFNAATTNVQCSDKYVSVYPFLCVCSKGKSDIN